MITPIDAAMEKLAGVLLKTGISKILESFQENNVLDPHIISYQKKIQEETSEQDVREILKKKRSEVSLQDFIKKGFELADGEFTKRMAALNSPTFAPRALSVGDGIKKKRKKYRKKANKG